jgi:RES domain-containing protein
MPFLWRISNHHDLSGKGALVASGRWHSSGLPLVYLAETPSGTLLEHLVHLVSRAGKLPKTYGLLKISVPEDLSIRDLDLPGTEGWKDSLELTQGIGDGWLSSLETSLARVPSVIIGDTWNILLNPLHPNAEEIKIVSVTQEAFDLRLFRIGNGDSQQVSG